MDGVIHSCRCQRSVAGILKFFLIFFNFLSLKYFGNSLGNSYTDFDLLDIRWVLFFYLWVILLWKHCKVPKYYLACTFLWKANYKSLFSLGRNRQHWIFERLSGKKSANLPVLWGMPWSFLLRKLLLLLFY